MLELIFQGFIEWVYGITLECWEYFSSALLDIMSLDFAYLKTHVPVINDIMQILLAAGWALLIGNLVFQALKSMVTGLGFEGEDPKLLFTRTFVFSFLLLASPQICEMGLNITSNLIALLEIPDAVNVALVDESAFGALTVSWLLVIIFDIIIMFKVFKLILEIAERYVILAMLTITAPLAFGVGGSRNTSEIFTGWCRMFGSMCLLMVTNVIFFKMLLSVLSTVPSGLDTLPWMVLVVTIVKVAKKADAIITRIGLNPAITGDGLGGRSLPGMLTYTVVRTMAQQVVKTAGKSIGGSRGQSGNASAAGGGPRGPRTGPTTGGAHFTGTAGTDGRPSGAASQSSQQTNTAQNTTAQNSQTQGGGTTQVGPQQTETRQQTTSTTSVGGTNSESRNNTTHRSESTRRSSVTPGARRGTSYMKNSQPGATGADRPGGKGMTAQTQPGVAQPRTGAEGTGTPRSAPGTKTWREGSAGISQEPTRGRTAGGTTGMRTDTAGTAKTPPSRFTAVTTQRVNEGGANSRVTASEQNNVSVGQPGQSQRAATDRQHSVKGQRQPPNPTGQGSTKPDSTVTRYTSRKIEKIRTSVPVSPAASAPNPTPAEQRTQTAPTTPKGRTQVSGTVPSGNTGQSSGAERHGRNDLSNGGGGRTGERRLSPARQERPPDNTKVVSKGTSPVQRPGTAGTALRAEKSAQTRQTARNQATGSRSTPTATGTSGGKRAASSATAQQEKARSGTLRHDRRPGNGGAKDAR